MQPQWRPYSVSAPAQQQSTNTPPTTNTQNNTLNDLSSIVAQLSLPKSELLPFDSDPKNYHAFITNFKTNIEARVSDPSAKLNYLIQYCTGTAKEVIADCVINPNKQKGYDTALELLEQQFGKPYDVARSYIESLTRVLHQDGREVTYQVRQRHVTLRDDSFTAGLHR